MNQYTNKLALKRVVYFFMLLSLLSTSLYPLPVKAAAPIPPTQTSQPIETQPAYQSEQIPPSIDPPQYEEGRVREAMETALQKYLDYLGPRYQTGEIEITLDGDWALGTTKWAGDKRPSESQVSIWAQRQQDGSWIAMIPNSSEEFYEMLEYAPKLLVPDDLRKEIILGINNSLNPNSSINLDPASIQEFPLLINQERTPIFQFPTRGTLGTFIFGSNYGQHTGIDIIHPNNTSLGDEVTVYPVYPGEIVAKWKDWSRKDAKGVCNRGGGIESVIVIYHSDINLYSMYFHMGNESTNTSYIDASIDVGDKVDTSTRLGKMGNRIYNPCTDGESYGAVFHHHFAITTCSTSGSCGIDPTPYFPGYQLKEGSTRTPIGTYVSPGTTPSTCYGPSLTSPANDYISPGNTITFVWNPTTCTGQNGYLLRVGTSSGGSDVLNEYSVQGLQTNYTFGSQWYNRDLYWSVRANASGAAWSGSRHFRIQPSTSCSYTSSQIILYTDGNYGGQCTVKNIGDYSNPSAIGLPNDAISSLKVGSNVQAILCENDNYLGKCETFLSDDSNLGDNNIGNDSVSSVKVQSRVQLPSIPSIYSPIYGTVLTEGDTITLSWSSTGTQYYGEIWGGASQVNFGPHTSTSKDVTSLLPAGYNYEWHIKAQNSAGYSGWSNSSAFTLKPKAPTSLSATVSSCTQVNLNWSDNSSNEEGYRIYRNGSVIGNVGAGVTNYQDIGLSGNTTYNYYVSAYRGSVVSASSNQVSKTTSSCVTVPSTPTLSSPADGTTFIEGQSIVLSWSATGNLYSGEIWGGTSQVNFGPQSATTKDVTSLLSAGYAYGWHVNAQNSAGTSSWSSSRTFTVLPGTPTNLVAQSPSCNQVNLSWVDRSGNEEGFNVYRDGVKIFTVGANGTSAVNTGLTGNTTYAYTVKAYRGSVLSNVSNTASVTTQTCTPADTEKPVVNWTLPVGNEQAWHVVNENVELSVSATDNVGVTRVHFYRWDNDNQITIGNDYTSPYSVTLDCSTLNLSLNAIYAKAYDAAGNQSDFQYIVLIRHSAQPDLDPFTPSGYSAPIVPSSVMGTHEPNELHANQPTYFDWHFANIGWATALGDFYVDLWIDDVRYIHYPYSDFESKQVGGFDDWNITVDTPGWHSVSLVVDPDNNIDEFSEIYNTWKHSYFWAPSAPYSDNMDQISTLWESTGLWHRVYDSSSYFNSYSGISSWWYGQEDSGNYDTGETNSGDLTSPIVYIPDSDIYYLRFKYWYQTESRYSAWDQRWIQASIDGSEFFNVFQLYDDNMRQWHNSPILNLSGLGGHTLQMRFHFDTMDSVENEYLGWYIDGFDISTTPPPTCNDDCEYNDTIGFATPIAYEETLNADICANGDYDYYSFDAMAGDAIVIDIDARSDGSLLDSYITLLASDGSILSTNDDDGETYDSKLGYLIDVTGTYYVKVRDYWHPSNGGPDYFYKINIFTDQNIPISAEITSPISDEWLNTSSQIITAIADDLESGISRVEFFFHSADWENEDWIWLGSDLSGIDGWSLVFDTSSLTEQQGAAFYIWAFDFTGNSLGAASWNLGIDHTPPETTLNTIGLYGGAPFRNFILLVDGSDNLSGISSFDIQVRDGSEGTWTDLLISSTDNYSYYLGDDGHTYYFRSRARDLAGNEGLYTGGDGQTNYSVQICAVAADIYEENDTVIQAKTIVVGDIPQAHNFHHEGDQDWVSFTVQKDRVYSISTENTGTFADTVIYLFSIDGISELLSNDDYEGKNYASQINWQAPESGTYYLLVRHWDYYGYGCSTTYTLSFSDVTEIYPWISSVSPDKVASGSEEISIVIQGSNFVIGSIVRWNGIDLVTSYQSENSLIATIPADLLMYPGIAEITVYSPELGGVTSNSKVLTIEGYTTYIPFIQY